MKSRRIYLSPDEMPRQWYNVVADVPQAATPVLHPGTLEPVTPDVLAPLFPMSVIEQEVSQERWTDIPDEVLDVLGLWRPAPLHRAIELEKALDTPAKIYFKNESVSPPGSHKPNTAVAQAYYNKKEGVKRIATETGAGQWGSALAFATERFGIELMVYMVKISYQQKPYRKNMMQVWGADVVASPSDKTNAGRTILEADPDCPGSLGLAISEAVEDAATHDDTKYSLGSVLNHVILHQTVIGLEAKKQLEKVGDSADIVIGCIGGGSNFGGLAFPFVPDKLSGKDIRLVAVEPTSCPTVTRGQYTFDYGDVAKLAPVVKMHTLGHGFIPPAIHAGGLRYHGMSPLVSSLVDQGLVEATNRHQLACFEAGVTFARSEGIIPAPESTHAVRVAIDEALKCKETGEAKTILFGLSGHGLVDMAAYEAYFAGQLHDYEYPTEDIEAALKDLPETNF